jgi:hypothetical protein
LRLGMAKYRVYKPHIYIQSRIRVARMHEGVASGQVGVGHEESLPCRGVLVRPQGDDHSNYNPFPGSLRLLEALPP